MKLPINYCADGFANGKRKEKFEGQDLRQMEGCVLLPTFL